ncbi:MAG: glutamine-hydrolyzing GMP synthase, partial [Deltaproteobacteria bacterium]|nr:glutamine-hydrolyzing GMP synthase [Deltaproteobacteria bacterium]
YSEIHSYNITLDRIKEFSPAGIVLSGSPSSVYDRNAPRISKNIFSLGVPVLGICYGMQIIARLFGGIVSKSKNREYGPAKIHIDDQGGLFEGMGSSVLDVCMSHGDRIERAPDGFIANARSENGLIASMYEPSRKIYSVQFHPEVAHTLLGTRILKNFLFNVCGCMPLWTMRSFIEDRVSEIREKVGGSKVVCGISGGVDSAVTAVIVHRAVGERLHCVFVDNGLLRKNEAEKVEATLKHHFHMRIHCVDAKKRFFKRLKAVADPERKRKLIGNEFIRVFEDASRKIKGVEFLAQGTLYPDVIESVSFKGPSAVIKSHHNVGGLLKRMKLSLIEPLRELFKDEVRVLGRELGMPEEVIDRHPFPGPGLAIRIIGAVTPERCVILREADAIVLEEIKSAGIYKDIWQAFAVLLPVKTVGVMGDERTYENALAVRAVESVDGMTADWARLPSEVLARISSRIINEVQGINRVVYDISSKPPGTIEWE